MDVQTQKQPKIRHHRIKISVQKSRIRIGRYGILLKQANSFPTLAKGCLTLAMIDAAYNTDYGEKPVLALSGLHLARLVTRAWEEISGVKIGIDLNHPVPNNAPNFEKLPLPFVKAIQPILFIGGGIGIILSGLTLVDGQIVSSILSGVTGIFLTTKATLLGLWIQKMKAYSRFYNDVLDFLGLPRPRIITPARIRHELAHRDFVSDAIEKLEFLSPDLKNLACRVSQLRRGQASGIDRLISQVLAAHGFEAPRDDIS